MQKLWEHQQDGIEAVLRQKCYGLFFDMGTGKTRTAIEAIRQAGCKRVLILAPLAVCPVWPLQIARWGDQQTDILDLSGRGTTAQKAERFAASTAGVVIVNYDSAWRGELGKALAAARWDAVIADEAHRLKSATGSASRWAAKLSARYRIALTGTPFGQNELDAFGIFRFINKNVFGTSWTAFKAQYAIMGGPHMNWIRGVRDVEGLRTRIAPWCSFVNARDVIDLPDETDTVIPVTLSPRAMQVYRDFESEMCAVLDDGDIMTASNALVKCLRLQQLAGGMAHGEETQERVCDAKLVALRELMDDLPAGEPLVVFGKFCGDVYGALAAAGSACREAYVLDGSRKENAAWDAAARAGRGAVLCCQMQAGGLGVDLTAARICVYLSTGYSVTDYMQSRARTMRAGQTRNVAYYHIRATGTIDEIVANALASKRDGVQATLDFLKHGKARHEGVVGEVQGTHA